MYTKLDFAVSFIYVCLGLISVGVFILLIMKARNIRLMQQQDAIMKKFKPYFIYLQRHIGDEGSFQPPKGAVTQLEARVIQDKLMEWIERFRGKQREKLTRLCEDMGLVQADLKKLNSMFYAKQMQAAFRLGGMRSPQAVPQLLELLRQEKAAELVRVIARAIAKCADDATSLEVMLRELAGREQHNELFAAEILEESSIDVTPLLVKCLGDNNNCLVKTVLLALRGHAGPELSPALLKLADNKDKDIRSLAIKLLVRTGSVLTKDRLCSWFKDPEWEVRAAVAESLGTYHHAVSIVILKEALTDTNWWVRYYSSKSLATMGDEGFRALCEAALEKDDPYKSDMAKDRIHEELLREHYFAKRRKQKASQATKRMLYEQYFGKAAAAPIFRSVGGDYSA